MSSLGVDYLNSVSGLPIGYYSNGTESGSQFYRAPSVAVVADPIVVTNTSSINDLLPGKSPWGIYDASKWNSSTNVLPEARGNGFNVTSTGVITSGAESGYGAAASIPYLTGTATSVLLWPVGSIPPAFTICSITRYNTNYNASRILQSNSGNWMHGHWNGNRGFVYYNGFSTATTGVPPATDWLNCCAKNGGTAPNNVRFNGVAYGTAVSIAAFGQLSINGNPSTEICNDWKFSYVVIYNSILTDAEMLSVSNKLNLYLSTGSFA